MVSVMMALVATFTLAMALVATLRRRSFESTLVVTVFPNIAIECLLLLRLWLLQSTLKVAMLPDVDGVRLAGVKRTCLVGVAALRERNRSGGEGNGK